MQFVIVYHLLKHGCPIINYESNLGMFDFLRVLNNLQHHWSDKSAWTTVKCMQKVMLMKTWLVIQSSRFISMFIYEVTIVDLLGWIVIHVYVIEGWRWILILSTFEQMLSNVIITNLIKVIVASLLQYDNLFNIDLTSKVINFCVNGLLVFE
jgi:hypothetical protein